MLPVMASYQLIWSEVRYLFILSSIWLLLCIFLSNSMLVFFSFWISPFRWSMILIWSWYLNSVSLKIFSLFFNCSCRIFNSLCNYETWGFEWLWLRTVGINWACAYLMRSGMTTLKKWASIYFSCPTRNLLKSYSWFLRAATTSLLIIWSCSDLNLISSCSNDKILADC